MPASHNPVLRRSRSPHRENAVNRSLRGLQVQILALALFPRPPNDRRRRAMFLSYTPTRLCVKRFVPCAIVVVALLLMGCTRPPSLTGLVVSEGVAPEGDLPIDDESAPGLQSDTPDVFAPEELTQKEEPESPANVTNETIYITIAPVNITVSVG